MESKRLEALLMAVDLGSYTKAAEVLGLTQSGITHMMKSLEKEIGFPLLERGHYGVKFTEDGKKLEGVAREYLRINALLESTIEQINSSRNKTIRISTFASMAMHWLPSIIQHFRAECPNVDVDIRMADASGITGHALFTKIFVISLVDGCWLSLMQHLVLQPYSGEGMPFALHKLGQSLLRIHAATRIYWLRFPRYRWHHSLSCVLRSPRNGK